MSLKTAIYMRVSTADQSVDSQRQPCILNAIVSIYTIQCREEGRVSLPTLLALTIDFAAFQPSMF